MKKKIIITALSVTAMLCSMAQPPKTPNEIPAAIPRHVAAQPQANIKPIKKLPFKQYITTITWKGARIWYSPGSATVDSVLTVQFTANGTVTWNKQGWEFVPRTAGRYTINGNRIEINFSYPPYTHTLTGTYDDNTGIITGTFREVRAADPSAPPAYSPGTTTGEFNFFKK